MLSASPSAQVWKPLSETASTYPSAGFIHHSGQRPVKAGSVFLRPGRCLLTHGWGSRNDWRLASTDVITQVTETRCSPQLPTRDAACPAAPESPTRTPRLARPRPGHGRAGHKGTGDADAAGPLRLRRRPPRASGRGSGTARARADTHLAPRAAAAAAAGAPRGRPRRSRRGPAGRSAGATLGPPSAAPPSRPLPAAPPAGGRARRGPRLRRARPRLRAGPRGLGALLRAAPHAAATAARSGPPQRGGPGPQGHPRRPLGRGPPRARGVLAAAAARAAARGRRGRRALTRMRRPRPCGEPTSGPPRFPRGPGGSGSSAPLPPAGPTRGEARNPSPGARGPRARGWGCDGLGRAVRAGGLQLNLGTDKGAAAAAPSEAQLGPFHVEQIAGWEEGRCPHRADESFASSPGLLLTRERRRRTRSGRTVSAPSVRPC
uniref:Uncharacterized protein n=1 Tax=Rangifer tarandus platyrhynchus TaxID=3082113 RepID=A0ACB0EN62_RANTA|nr:unnamed protein product [Rangifer tarandus platyrhynchus]